jgi:hypothetical protein
MLECARMPKPTPFKRPVVDAPAAFPLRVRPWFEVDAAEMTGADSGEDARNPFHK